MSQLYLVGIDCSECGNRALEYATQKARAHGNRILVAHVIEWSPYSFNTVEENAERHKRREAELERAHKEVVDPVVAQLREQGIDAEGEIRHGHIAKTLKQLADEHHANTIVVGRHGQSSLVGRLFGSVSGTFACLLTVLPAMAQQGVDERIDQVIRPYADGVSGFIFSSFPLAGVQIPFVLVWLLLAATIFTFYFKFVNFRAFRHGFQLVRGDYSDPMAAGEVTHFQALATALSGTVGLGNIAGVAIAVSLGGPGATFWMILAGLLGMSSKFVECTLGVKYRNEYTDGTVSGGPMYYLSKGLAERSDKLAFLGKILAVLFAIFCVGGSFGGGNMFQANQSFKQLLSVTGGDASWLADKGWLFGLIIALLVGMVIIGGIKGIARVTSKIVPFMAVIYVSAGLVIIFMNLTSVPAAFGSIIDGAFKAEGIAGGIVGVLFQGFKRAAFSNEAGIGSAAIAHSAVRQQSLILRYVPITL
jgi:AGCS family alanine or glycine:cation symporter